MEGIINSVRNLFGTYGFHAAAVVLATIAVVNVVKRPLVKKAEELAARTGIDKSVVTKNVTIIPVAVAFVIEIVVAVIAARFDFRAVDYGKVVTTSVLYGALAIATYESVKKQLRAYAASLNVRFRSGRRRIKSRPKNRRTTAKIAARFRPIGLRRRTAYRRRGGRNLRAERCERGRSERYCGRKRRGRGKRTARVFR